MIVGVSTNDYAQLLLTMPDAGGHGLTGISPCIIPNRLSYLLDLHGPSEAIDTACSSSLVAVHHAVQSVLNGECEMALAGGINVILSPTPFIAFSRAGMLAPDGQCKCLDKSANGYVRGEGGGVVLLKPLHAALADGDHIYGVIKGIAMNHGGRAQQLTAPNPTSQTNVIKTALDKAQVDANTIGYVELHGTGTTLGDSIEIEGLTQAFSKNTKKHCGIGSVKSNMGHLEPAAGIASLIKVVLALQHKTLPPTLHLHELNPYLKLAETPFFPVVETQPWNSLLNSDGTPIPRRAGVSSFGFGGVNVHAIIEEWNQPKQTSVPSAPFLFILSAKNRNALYESVKQLADYLNKHPRSDEQWLSDVSYTLQVGREQFPVRVACIASTKSELCRKLHAFSERAVDEVLHNLNSEKVTTKRVVADADFFTEMSMIERARYWVEGQSIPWQILADNKKRYRVPLPGYPFTKRRYWYDNYKTVPEDKIHVDVEQIINRCQSSVVSERPDLFVKVITNREEVLATLVFDSEISVNIHTLFYQILRDVWQKDSPQVLQLDWTDIKPDEKHYLYMQRIYNDEVPLFNVALMNRFGQLLEQAAAVNF